MKTRLPLAALLIAATAQTAFAFMPDDEARRAVVQLRNDTEARFQKLESGSRGQLELANQLDELRGEVARLRGQVEVLTHELETAQKRQRDFYVDLDNRLRRLEPGAAGIHPAAPGTLPGATGPATPQAPVVDTAAESREFEAALGLVKEGKHADAFSALDRFTKTRPQSALLPGAHFWAGSSALQARNIGAAISHFNNVIERFPQDTRAPDAMLGLANAQQALNDPRAARRTLETLLEKYPASDAAQVAKQRLAAR